MADGTKETSLNAAQVCLLTLCSGKSAVPRAQRVGGGEEGREGKAVSAQAGSAGLGINMAFKQIAAQN